jgi:hypothetical protein
MAVKPALEVIVLSGNRLNPTLNKYLLEANNGGSRCNRVTGAQIPAGPGSLLGTNYQNTATISVSNGLIMRVIPIFNSSKIGISSSVVLPTQGTSVESVGTSGETSRKVRYFSSHPQIPLEIFPYSLISQ